MKTLGNPKSIEGLLKNSEGWMDIDELVDVYNETESWGVGFEQRAIRNAKKAYIRKAVSKLKDSEGFPKFPSVAITDSLGNTRRVYKQETLFDVEDYKRVVNFHASLSNHHKEMAKGYVRRAL